jgi:hypothetical protein
VIVNILCFHAFLEPVGISTGLVAAVLWLVVFAGARTAFAGVFVHRHEAA